MSSPPTKKPPTILIVDDDSLILASLRGLFLLETDYEIIEHSDPKAAVEEAARRPVDLVISDFLMPGMNGVELLGKIKSLQPDAVRILLTGFADKENAIRGINEVGLYQYLEKPWANEDLLLLIRNALRERSLRGQLAEKIDELSALIDRHTDLSDKHSSLERELEMAARVQRGLLPEKPPQGKGFRFASYYQPSTTLGGDFYDAAEREDGTILLLADVSGHGVQAALTSMLLKASFHQAAQGAADSSALFDSMNNQLYQFLPSGMYACASTVWIRPGESQVCVANAGLPYPRLLAAGDKRIDELPLSGMPLGMFSESMPGNHDIQHVEMRRGDVLLLASDGLGDVQSPDGTMMQEGALGSAFDGLAGLDGEEVIARLVERATKFAAGASPPDDLSIVALTRS